MNRLIIIIVFITVIDLNAQYFGRNKVQYEKFDFNVLGTEYFDIYHYPGELTAVKDAAVMLERWNDRFSEIFGKRINKPQPIILYANHADFQQTNVISGMIPQGTGGVTEGLKNRIVLPLTGNYQENDHVLGHELVHAFQYEIFKGMPGGLASNIQMPLWFIEGLAEYLSIGRSDPFTAMWMRDAVLNDDVPSIDDVSSGGKYFPYRYGHAIWAFIGGYYGDVMVGRLFNTVASEGWDEGWKSTFGIEIDSVSVLWEAAMRETYGPDLEGRTPPKELGREIVSGEDRMNLAPVISPDGKYLALFTTEDLLTLDLFLIDAATGEIIQKLVSADTDRHFDALRSINSAGSWSPDSRKFAFAVIEDGDDKVSVVDTESGKVEKLFSIQGVDAIQYLDWSPDGNNLVVSGTSGGISDLYLYDFRSGTSRRLTDDKFTEIHPAFSPDGKTLAFATDRSGSAEFDYLNLPSLKIALMDIADGNRKLITLGEGIKHINPQFSPDGTLLYFISNPDGFNDVYSYNIVNGSTQRITKAATGISGLTDNSPAISVAAGTGEIILSVFNKSNFEIRSLMPSAAAAAADPVERRPLTAGMLPPATISPGNIVDDYLNETAYSTAASDSFSISGYSPGLDLLYIGQPSIGIAVDRFSTGIGGGVSMVFGDMLGNHMLGTALQINGGIKDLGGQAIYQNRSGRFNWGGAVGHIPYQSASLYYQFRNTNVNGQNMMVRDVRLLRQRVFLDMISAIGEYPLSTNRRFEVNTGYTRISYDVEEQQIVYSQFGDVISEDTRELPSPPGLNLFQTSAAYVGDYSFFGFTSPINGSRFRFEAEQTFGSLTYTAFLADYRRYFFFNPVTIAFRGMHYGRYFGNSEDTRLSPLYLGYDTWVRGYNINDISAEECTHTGSPGICPEIDRMIGSKIGLFNAEIRVPLFGVEQFGLINFPYLPTEVGVFFDAGIAWTKATHPVLKFTTEPTDERIPVTSAGFTARFNVLGYIVVETYYSFPFQRPNKSGQFGFILTTGW